MAYVQKLEKELAQLKKQNAELQQGLAGSGAVSPRGVQQQLANRGRRDQADVDGVAGSPSSSAADGNIDMQVAAPLLLSMLAAQQQILARTPNGYCLDRIGRTPRQGVVHGWQAMLLWMLSKQVLFMRTHLIVGLQDVQRALAAASQWDASNVREEDLFMLRRTCTDLSLVRAGWLLWLARWAPGLFVVAVALAGQFKRGFVLYAVNFLGSLVTVAGFVAQMQNVEALQRQRQELQRQLDKAASDKSELHNSLQQQRQRCVSPCSQLSGTIIPYSLT